MKLMPEIDYMSMVIWWFDVSYNTYEECKGNIGSMIYLSNGAVASYSRIKTIKCEKLNRNLISGET